MKHADLDATDFRILRELQKDGRLSNVELASRVGLSPPPTLRRVQALEALGYIAGYRAILNGPLLGFGVQLLAMVGLKSQSEQELRAFEEKIAGWPLVREAYTTSGVADFMLRCCATNMTELQDFIISVLTAAPNVDSVKTTMVMRVAKYEPGVPL